MIWYLFTAIGFPPGGSGRLTCVKVGKGQIYRKGEAVHKPVQKRENTNMGNKHGKTSTKRLLKSLSRVIKK